MKGNGEISKISHDQLYTFIYCMHKQRTIVVESHIFLKRWNKFYTTGMALRLKQANEQNPTPLRPQAPTKYYKCSWLDYDFD